MAAYPKKSKQICQQEFNVEWTELKKGEGLEDKVVALLRELKSVELGIPAIRIRFLVSHYSMHCMLMIFFYFLFFLQ